MTYSIVARDPETGDLGVAVQSRFLAVGSVVPWARASVGTIATQALANVDYGPQGLRLLERGRSAEQVVRALTRADGGRAERQIGVVDAAGRAATYTGRACFRWAGGRTAENVAAQGNILAGPEVVDALIEAFQAGGAPFPELLVACLRTAQAAGGDRRGVESAALLVVRAGGGYGGGNDRWIDLRVDDSDDPIGELGRLLALRSLYFDRPSPDDLVALHEPLAAELRARLERVGFSPDRPPATTFERMAELPGQAPEEAVVGTARPFPTGWDRAWQRALLDWMAVENLEARTAADGWIDGRVLAVLREKVAGNRVGT